ncbi:hypothetical protein [Acidihalobacter ferrooxydans]|uniref:Sulfotransferase domain-containing protein n=1 Tax=Acidihalobacter ferrooxydans TaxID=1765967 RepID=A0A1P8UI29_9GAMM|nr:hypothetical protein [Acidihalobacter ferrooxydans]APZ43477.1 hypothetical protein BW247_10570 [Acidihalobacter ferrooxydans]
MTRRSLDHPLLFLHLPKAAGTRVFSLLQEVLRPRRTSYYLDRTQFCSFDDFTSLAPDIRATVLTDERIENVSADLIAGHVSRQTLLALCGSRQGNLLVIAREPRSRILSHWLYWKTYDARTRAAYGAWGDRIALAGLELADFLARDEIACQTDNIFLRMLLWPHPAIPDRGFIAETDDPRLLAEAESRLDGFAHADVVENPRMLTALESWLSHEYPLPASHFVLRRIETLQAKSGKKNNTASPEALADCGDLGRQIAQAESLLERRTRLDARLWQRINRVDGDAIKPAQAFANTLERYERLAKTH